MKRVVVFGASRGSGRHFVTQSLEAGDEVTAVLRDPTKLALSHPRLRVEKGDVYDRASVERLVRGHDAIVSTVGPNGREKTAVYSKSCESYLAAMEASGVRRLIVTSATGLDEGTLIPFPLNLLRRYVVAPLLRNAYDDVLVMEAMLAKSDVDWTIVRAPMLTNGAHSGRFRSAIGERLPRNWRISRADLAQHLREVVSDERSYRKRTEASY